MFIKAQMFTQRFLTVPSMYREVSREGRLADALGQSLASIAEVRDELIKWQLGQKGSALVYRKSYEQLCKAIVCINPIPLDIHIPAGRGDTIIHYTQLISTDKRRRISREKRLENAKMMIGACLEKAILPPKIYSELLEISWRLQCIEIPWRFEKKPKRMKS